MPPLSIMIKPSSSLCNMRCKYCFYHSIANSREVKTFGLMKRETAQNIIDKALDFADGESIYFAFQGGEPLLSGLDFFENFVNYVKEKNIKRSVINFSLQTNGTLINNDWAKFFKKNNFLIGLSLDGDKNANLFRVDNDYRPTFNRVNEASKILSNFGVDFNILIVATGYTAEHIENVFNYFKNKGVKYLQFIPCLRPFKDKSESQLYMTVSQYESYLIRLFNLYVKSYVEGKYVSIRHFDNMVRLFLNQPCEQCGMQGHCSHQFVVEGNGNVYPCDFYCLDEWLLGNINTSDNFDILAHSKLAIDFIKNSFNIKEECKACPFYRVCRGGGCKRNREDRDYCLAYKSFFSKCLPLFRVFLGEKPR